MKKNFRKALVGSILLSLTTMYGSMFNTVSATSNYDKVSYNGHDYQLIDQSMDWSSAEQYCESLGGHLVTITSADEQQFVSNLASNSSKKNIWLGAVKNADGKFAWVTGEHAQFSNWSTGEPSNYDGTENAVMMYTYSNNLVNLGEWNDISASGGTVSGFTVNDIAIICEWDNSTTSSETTAQTTAVTDATDYQIDQNGNVVTDENGAPVFTNSQGYVI